MAGKRLAVSEVDKQVARALNARRIELGFTVRKLEELSGVSKSNVHKTLSGESTIQIGILELLCDALGLTDWKVLREAHQRLDAPRSARVTQFPTQVDEPTPEALQRAAASQQTPDQDTGEETDQ